SGLGRVCRGYRHLDRCEHRIAPHEVKYQLRNVDTRTLFHCNCTRRLVRSLRRVRDSDGVEPVVLADRIAGRCFVLEPLTNCSLGTEPQHNCVSVPQAVLVSARHLRTTLRRWGAPHATSKVKLRDWNT
ncbi:PA2G3 phospholipase, partial [Alectura lathami]|nr:PA2G3 phospholipase [Alectura lathami]